jgi:hypothetical protein
MMIFLYLLSQTKLKFTVIRKTFKYFFRVSTVLGVCYIELEMSIKLIFIVFINSSLINANFFGTPRFF